jgi:hypothetical protein
MTEDGGRKTEDGGRTFSLICPRKYIEAFGSLNLSTSNVTTTVLTFVFRP